MTSTERQLWEYLGKRVWQAKAILGHPRHLVDVPLSKFGLAPLEAIEIVIEAETHYGVEIHDDLLPAQMNIRAIGKIIDQLLEVKNPARPPTIGTPRP